MKIAVVRNRKKDGILYQYGRPSPETYGKKSVQRVMDALRHGGHEIKVMEGDVSLFTNLRRFIPVDENGQPSGLVFNMSYGIQGDCRYTHVPALLEMLGVPYTGANPLGHSICLDKVVTKQILMNAGIPTPNMAVVATPDAAATHGLRYPLVVKPRHESTSNGLFLVHDDDELKHAVSAIVCEFEQDALVEEYIPGREFCIGVLGNGAPEVLPFVELHFNGREHPLLTREDKFHRTTDEPQKVCPVRLSSDLYARIREIVRETFTLCHCRDYARVDLRVDTFGNPYVLEINSMASLGQGGTFVVAAREAGYTFEGLINEIVAVAGRRAGLEVEPVATIVQEFQEYRAKHAMHVAA